MSGYYYVLTEGEHHGGFSSKKKAFAFVRENAYHLFNVNCGSGCITKGNGCGLIGYKVSFKANGNGYKVAFTEVE